MRNKALTTVGISLGMFAAAALAQTEKWVARYNGPENGWDDAFAIAADDLGNVYVTGSSVGEGGIDCLTIKYDRRGNEVWVARFRNGGGSAIAVDDSGSVFVAGGSSGDYLTVKYDAGGDQVWVSRYDGPGEGSDGATALALDGVGGVYVTGDSDGKGTRLDYATVKYDATTGNQVWEARYDGGIERDDWARALTLDASGNVYVSGVSNGKETLKDMATIKYDSDTGEALWVARYDKSGRNSDEAAAIAVDKAGNVYVTGISLGDYLTIKYDATTGNQVWEARYDGPVNSSDRATDLALDTSGNVYVTGISVGKGTVDDYATIRYDPETGTELWVTRYNGPGSNADAALAVRTDNSGNVYVTGFSIGARTGHDYATVKYDAVSGKQLWVTRYNGPANKWDDARALAVDEIGNVYITGYSYGDETDRDYATIRYSQPSDTCKGDEKLKVNCFVRCRDGRQHVQTTVKTELNQGTELTLTLDGGDPIVVKLRRNGKAKTKWLDVAPGVHELRIVECEVSKQTNCCG